MEWIRVKDRLPSEPEKQSGIQVLCDGRQACVYWNPDNDTWDTRGRERCHYCGGASRIVFNISDKAYHDEVPTHWMPLPASPKED